MLFLLTGEDRFRILERGQDLRREFMLRFPGAAWSDFDLVELGREGLGNMQQALAPGLFAAERGVIVRTTETTDGDILEKLSGWVEPLIALSEVWVIMMLPGKVPKKASAFAWWMEQATIEHFPLLDTTGAKAWVRTWLGKHPLHPKIEPAALDTLVTRIGSDTGYLDRVLERLALSCEGAIIRVQDVAALLPPPLEADVFAALGALISGQRARALKLFWAVDRTGTPAPKTLGACAWQLRLLIGAKELFQEGQHSAARIAQELGANPYSVQKILPHLGRFDLGRLRQALIRVADFDQAIKSGTLHPSLALDLFVWRF